MQYIIHPGRCHPVVNKISECRDSHLQQILEKCTDHTESKEKYKSHDPDKTWNCCIFSREDPVNLYTAKMFLTFFWFHDSFITDSFNEIKTHVGNCRCSVESSLFFHLLNNMFQHFLFILIKLQTVHDQLISLCQLRCRKANRNLCGLGMVFDQMHDRMEASVDCTTIFIRITKIYILWLLLIFCNMECMGYQFVNSFILGR